jgi:hypothetical protein
LILTILVLLSTAIKNELPILVLPIVGIIYVFFMFRRVFRQSALMTLMKMLIIGLLYLASFAFLILCTTLVSLISV